MIKLKIPKKKDANFIKKFFKKKNLDFSNIYSKEYSRSNPIEPVIKDLYFLYQLLILNKRTTILEFGSGWSSLIFNLALYEIKAKYLSKTKDIQKHNLFELFILENSKKFLNITKSRIINFNKNSKLSGVKINYCLSDVEMTTFNDRICTKYKKLPLCIPDFIYLDGPDTLNVKKKINGITTKYKGMSPLSSDILRLEYFFMPGTIIVCDGRAQNVRFLKNNLQRNWKYFNFEDRDISLFLLNESSLGKINEKIIKFYNI